MNIKLCPTGTGDRLGRRRFNPIRIDRSTIFIHAETEVRSCGQTGAADVTYPLTLSDPLAFCDAIGEALHVQIDGFIAAVVANLNIIAVAAGVTFLDDDAIANTFDRCPSRSSVIDGRMRFPGLCDRVEATHGESRRDTGERERRFQESFAQTPAIGIVVVKPSVAVLVQKGLEGGALVGELCG